MKSIFNPSIRITITLIILGISLIVGYLLINYYEALYSISDPSKLADYKENLRFIIPIIPLAFSMILDLIASVGNKYLMIDKKRIGVFDFQREFKKFLKSHSRKMEGDIFFYNIPLTTFEDSKLFESIWVNTIGKNKKINEIKFLLDEQFRDNIKRIYDSNQVFFNSHQGRFKFKFMDLRNPNKNIPSVCPFINQIVLNNNSVYSLVNFAVWSKENKIVTMTAEFKPFGAPNTFFDFLAFPENDRSRISDFVISEYNSIKTEFTPETL